MRENKTEYSMTENGTRKRKGTIHGKRKKTDQNKMKSNIFGVVRVESEKKETLD